MIYYLIISGDVGGFSGGFWHMDLTIGGLWEEIFLPHKVGEVR